MQKKMIIAVVGILFVMTAALANEINNIKYDEDNDGWVHFTTLEECSEMFDAGVPVECDDILCVGCADKEGNPMWCNDKCKVTAWNYAIYLTTQIQADQSTDISDEYRAKIDWMFKKLLKWSDCYKLCRDEIPNNIFSECFENERYAKRLSRYIERGRCPGEQMP